MDRREYELSLITIQHKLSCFKRNKLSLITIQHKLKHHLQFLKQISYSPRRQQNLIVCGRIHKANKMKYLVIAPLIFIPNLVSKWVITTECQLDSGEVEHTHNRTSRGRQITCKWLLEFFFREDIKGLMKDFLVSTFCYDFGDLGDPAHCCISNTWSSFHCYKTQQIIFMISYCRKTINVASTFYHLKLSARL